MVPPVITKTHYSINHIYYRGGRYRQVSLYFAQCPSWGSNRETSDVYYNVVANTSAVASVLASSHPIWRCQVAGNAPWITACTTLTITDDGDTQAKHWAAFQISHKRHVELSLNSDKRKWDPHPLSWVQCQAGCWIRIKNLWNLCLIFIYHGFQRYRTLWFKGQESYGFWKETYLGLVQNTQYSMCV